MCEIALCLYLLCCLKHYCLCYLHVIHIIFLTYFRVQTVRAFHKCKFHLLAAIVCQLSSNAFVFLFFVNKRAKHGVYLQYMQTHNYMFYVVLILWRTTFGFIICTS